MRKNILYFTISTIDNLRTSGIYTDLIRNLSLYHNMFVVTAISKIDSNVPMIEKDGNVTILRVKTGKLTKTSPLKKILSLLFLNTRFRRTIKKNLTYIPFDMLLYATPPVVFNKLIKKMKRKYNLDTYLMLKDIFPQNAVDLGFFTKLNPIYTFFRSKEKKLYKVSDKIGCMSHGNIEYLLRNNKKIDKSKVEYFPNSIECSNNEMNHIEKSLCELYDKYSLPKNKKIFVYGGNFGKPQGIDFVKKCILLNETNEYSYFIFLGAGTEYSSLKEFIYDNKLVNSSISEYIPKHDFDDLLSVCHVGLVFLDYRFTIPNIPSRILAYMNAGLPILAATDIATDLKSIIIDNEVGYWCPSNDENQFNDLVNMMARSDLHQLKINSKNLLLKEFNVNNSVNKINNFLER